MALFLQNCPLRCGGFSQFASHISSKEKLVIVVLAIWHIISEIKTPSAEIHDLAGSTVAGAVDEMLV